MAWPPQTCFRPRSTETSGSWWCSHAAVSPRGSHAPGAEKQIWPVFEEYRHLLEKHGLREPEDALRDAASLIGKGKIRVQFRAVVAGAIIVGRGRLRIIAAVSVAPKRLE